MSISADILNYLDRQAPAALATLGPREIGEALGYDSIRMSKLLWSLEKTQRLELRRDGSSIVGVAKLLRVGRKIVAAPPRELTPVGVTQHLVSSALRTPHTDRYEAAKHQLDMIDTGDDEYLAIEVKTNPIAEEALLLKRTLIALQGQYAQLSTNYRMLKLNEEARQAETRSRASASVHEFRRESQPD